MRSHRRFSTSDSLRLHRSTASRMRPECLSAHRGQNFQERLLRSLRSVALPQMQTVDDLLPELSSQTFAHRRCVTQPQCATSDDATILLFDCDFASLSFFFFLFF